MHPAVFFGAAIAVVIASGFAGLWLSDAERQHHERQREAYRAACEAIGGRPLVTRTERQCYVPTLKPLENPV